MTGDSNAGALDAALDVATVYVDLAPPSSSHVRQHAVSDKVFGNVIDKAFSAGKSSTVAKGKALLLKIIEVAGADKECSKECCAYLLAKLADKKPKVPPTCLEVLREAVAAFGARALPVKDLVAALGPVFNGSNGPAREQAMALALELARWIGKAPLHALLDSVRSAQKTEFEKAYSEREAEGATPPVPTVWLRKERPAEGAEAGAAATWRTVDGVAPASSSSSASAGGSAQPIDAREFVDEVDLPKKLRASEFGALVASDKWAEQLRAMQIVVDALGPTPKVKPGSDVHDVLAAVKSFLRQGHIQVQTAALKAVALLADGMRQEFGAAVRPVTQAVVGKCKEKKLVGEVQAALAAVLCHCLPFDSLADDVLAHLRDKKVPPHGRVCMMEFLSGALTPGAATDARERISTDSLKGVADALVGCCEDSDPKVREVSAHCLALFAPLVRSRGRPALDAHKTLMALEQTAPRVFKKMQAGADGASSLAAGSAASTARPAIAPPAKKAPASPTHADIGAITSGASRFDDDAVPPSMPSKRPATATTSAATKRPGLGTTAASSKSGVVAAKKPASSASAASGGADKEDDAVDDLALSAEDAQEQLAALGLEGWAGPAQEAMASSNWQVKADAVAALGSKIAELRVGGKYSAALVAYLAAKTAGFKISNVNILKAVMHAACGAAQHVGDEPFSRSAAWELLKHLGDKGLSDKKTRDLTFALLSALAAALKPAFVVKRMRAVMDKTKAPLAHQHYLEWVKEAVAEFGAGALPVQAVGGFCQASLDNKVAAVRTAAVEAMGALYHQIGPRLASALPADDLKPAVRALLDAEYARVGHDPTAASKAPKAGAVAGGGDAGVGIPRQDLFALLDKNALSELTLVDGKNSWQNRKAAIEAVIAACERSGHYLDASKGATANLSDLLKALKARVNDTQANLKPLAATAIGHVVASLDPEPGARHLRAVASGLIAGLGDNKKPMRDATVAALQMAVTLNRPGGAAAPAEVGLLAALVGPLGDALVATAVGRQELLAFLLQHAQAEPCVLRTPVDCGDLPGPLVLAMQDKTAAVRALAEQLLGLLVAKAAVSRQALEKATRDLAPAAKRTIMPSVDRMLAAYGSKKAGAVNVELPASAAAEPPVSPSAAAAADAAAAAVVPAVKQRVMSPPKARPAALTVTAAAIAIAAVPPAPPSPSPGDGAASMWGMKKTSKAKRLEEFSRLNWPQPPEEPGDTELAALRTTWEPLLSPDLAALLFPRGAGKFAQAPNQDGCLAGVGELIAMLQGGCPHAPQHSDLLLRYACYALCLRETAGGLLKVLALLVEVFAMLKAHGHALHDGEVACVLPQLIDKAGHKSERHKAAFKAAINAAGDVMSGTKLCQQLLQGLASKNKRTRVVCLEEIQRVVEGRQSDGRGATALGRAGVREVAQYLDSKDNDVSGRHACLELCYALYVALGSDLPKLTKLLGELSERASSMVEDRVRQKNKTQQQQHQPGVAPAPAPSAVSLSSAATVVPAARPAPALQASSPHVPLDAAATGSPSPFKLDMTPEQAAEPSADYGDAAEPTRLNMHVEGAAVAAVTRIKPLSLSPTLPQMAANWAAPTPGGNASSRRSLIPPAASRTSPARIGISHSAAMPRGAGAASPTSGSPRRGRSPEHHQPTTSTSSSSRPGSHSPGRRTGFGSSANSAFGAPGRHSSPSGGAQRPPVEETDSGLIAIFDDIESKVDLYLSAATAEAPMASGDELQALCDEAKDYLKMLHSIVSGEWSKETPLPADERALHRRAEGLCRRLVSCVSLSFNKPTTATATPTSLFGIDVSMVAVALATLFAMVRRPDLSQGVPLVTLESVFQECLRRIVDPRLSSAVTAASPASQESSKETAQQVVRALNIVLLKLASEAPTGRVVCALVHVLLLCVPASEIDPAARARFGEVLPAASTKPASRLLLRVLAEESKRSRPFADPATFGSDRDAYQVLASAHDFLALQPSVGTVDETPATTVRAVLSEMVKALGGVRVMSMLLELQLPTNAVVVRIVSRIANLPVPILNAAAVAGSVSGAGAGSPGATGRTTHDAAQSQELAMTLTALIDEITSARDKMAPIRRLHALKKQHPALDVQPFLQTISAAFRRFVLDSLSKLDADGPASSSSSSSSVRKSVCAVKASESPNENKTVSNMSGGKMDAVAGNGAATLRQSMPLTPRILMNAAVRGSLNSLSASLSLPTGASAAAAAAAAATSTTTSLAGDSDLAARLQRLKNMERR